MHLHHKLALDKARSQFKIARNQMNRLIQQEQIMRGFMFVRDLDSRYHIQILKNKHYELITAIDDYLAAGEILVCVERLLEKAS